MSGRRPAGPSQASAATTSVSTPPSAPCTTRGVSAGPTVRREPGRAGGLGRCAPRVARWLGDIRRYFPSAVVQVMQRDAIDRLDLRQLLLEPELLAVGRARPAPCDVAASSSTSCCPTRRGRRHVKWWRTVLADLERRLTDRTRAAVHGALARAGRSRRPTARRRRLVAHGRTPTCATAMPEHGTVIPERIIGFGRRRQSLAKDVIVAVDQSGSMADSVVYASLFGSVLAQLPSLRTRSSCSTRRSPISRRSCTTRSMCCSGSSSAAAPTSPTRWATAGSSIERPSDTVLFLISDLFEGGNPD